MFKIAICDDETHFRNHLKRILISDISANGFVYEIDTFRSGKELMELGIEISKYKIVFLDINMDELDGIKTAQKIREINKDLFIVFITAYINYTLEGYKVDAFRYILKDSNQLVASVSECMEAIHEKMIYTVSWKDFQFIEGYRKVSLERLLYIESRLHKLTFHIMEDELKKYTLYKTLNHIEKEYELTQNDFVRIHQSYLVNKKFIKNVNRYKVVLSNGTQLAIPKARYKYVEEIIIAYMGEV